MPNQPLVSVSIIGDKELAAALKKAGQIGQKVIREQIKESADAIRDRYKRDSSKHNKTGQMQGSIYSRSSDGWHSAEIGSDLQYAFFLEVGTRAHGPVRAKFLSWIGEDGNRIFAKWVRGIPAHPYLANATAGETKGIDEKMAKKLEKEFQKLGLI